MYEQRLRDLTDRMNREDLADYAAKQGVDPMLVARIEDLEKENTNLRDELVGIRNSVRDLNIKMSQVLSLQHRAMGITEEVQFPNADAVVQLKVQLFDNRERNRCKKGGYWAADNLLVQCWTKKRTVLTPNGTHKPFGFPMFVPNVRETRRKLHGCLDYLDVDDVRLYGCYKLGNQAFPDQAATIQRDNSLTLHIRGERLDLRFPRTTPSDP